MFLRLVTPYKLISHENANIRKVYFIIACNICDAIRVKGPPRQKIDFRIMINSISSSINLSRGVIRNVVSALF